MADWLITQTDFDDIVEFIGSRTLKKVGLQFPNDLLSESVSITIRLQELCEDVQFAIMADSPFGGCCVDEVAGQHYSVDSIVHFGPSCLTQITAGVPVLFVFGHRPLNSDLLRSALTELTVEGPVLLFYDFVFFEVCRRVLEEDMKQVVMTHPALSPEDTGTVRCCGRLLPTLESSEPEVLKRYALLHIGRRDLGLSNVLLSVNHCRSYHLLNADNGVVEALDRQRELRRRLLLIEKAAAAQRVGILVGAMSGGPRYVTIVARLERLIRNSEKRCYTLYVGKLTPEKLQNFPNIECFVLVGCQQNSLFDIRGQLDYNIFQPIVSPYEMEQALKPTEERNWSLDFVTDLEQLILEEDKEKEKERDESSDVAVPTNRIIAERSSDWSVTSQLPRRAVEEGHTWFGLEPARGQTPVMPPVRGRSGIAIAYEEEPQ